MLIDGIEVTAAEDLAPEEIQSLVESEQAAWKAKGKKLASVDLSLDKGEVVIKSQEYSPIRRIRRITGYLSTTDRFNDAKQAELHERVSHL